MKRFASAVLLLAAATCGFAQPPAAADPPKKSESRPRKARAEPPPPGGRELAVAMSYLPGTYESIEQEKGGPGPGTRMRIVPIWVERTSQGEYWFYVEHTKIESDTKPFRQRIYRFTNDNRKFSGDVFALPGDAREFVGEWKKAKPFASYSASDVREYEGCRLAIGHMMTMWWARTEGKACRAETPGAGHEATEMFVSTAGMKNGHQAYDPDGRLIAGEPGVWDFRRVAPVAQ